MPLFHPALPPVRPILWAMKPLSSAQTTCTVSAEGQLHLTITHDLVRHVTPTMLHWWFLHIDGAMMYHRRHYPRYLVWHPRDHILYQDVKRAPDGSAGAGSYRRIVEAFGRNRAYLVDSVEEVAKLDETGIVLRRRIGSAEVFRLEHQFSTVAGGTQYLSEMIVGTTAPLARTVFNRIVRPWLFSDDMGPAWLQHNVEEVGNFEYFLPALYAQVVKGAKV